HRTHAGVLLHPVARLQLLGPLDQSLQQRLEGPSWTYRRLMARQAWPQLKKRPTEMALAASSRSASSSTMQGSLPPSSRTTFLRKGAAAAITFLPVGVEPVSATLRMSGWVTIALPVLWPRTTLTTPSGSPPSISAS